MDPTEEAGTTSQTEEQAIDSQVKQPESSRDKPRNPRDEIFERIDAKRNAGLETDAEYALKSGHPMAVQVEAERRANAKSASAQSGTDRPTENASATGADAEGAEAVAGSDEPEAPARGGGSDKDADPLADYVVVKDGKPALKLKVDGAETLVPLDTARATLQKGTAAERRLQQAAEERKQIARERAQLEADKAELARRAQSQPSAPAAAVDDQSVREDAKVLVSSLLSEPEDKAVETVAKVLAKHRQAPAPVNADEVAAKAAKAVRQELREEDTKKDQAQGYQKFKSQYPEIESSPELFRVADSKTDAIAVEHPEWTPEQVMLEAGRQTKEWLESIGGKPNAKPTPPPTTDRQARKDNLRPVPPTRSARQAPTPKEESAETPAAILAQMRKARGQAL